MLTLDLIYVPYIRIPKFVKFNNFKYGLQDLNKICLMIRRLSFCAVSFSKTNEHVLIEL